MEAAQLRAHFPRQGDVLPPWVYAKETIDVCTVEPFPSERVTLFLRSTLSGPELAQKLESDFFEGMQLTVKVSEAQSGGLRDTQATFEVESRSFQPSMHDALDRLLVNVSIGTVCCVFHTTCL